MASQSSEYFHKFNSKQSPYHSWCFQQLGKPGVVSGLFNILFEWSKFEDNSF